MRIASVWLNKILLLWLPILRLSDINLPCLSMVYGGPHVAGMLAFTGTAP